MAVRVVFRRDDRGVAALVSPTGEVGRFTRRYAERVADRARALAPVGATGNLKGSIVVRQARDRGGRFTSSFDVIADAPYSLYAHEGREPGEMPPDAPIRAWVISKEIDESATFLIRRKIGRVGTGGTPFLSDAVEQVRV